MLCIVRGKYSNFHRLPIPPKPRNESLALGPIWSEGKSERESGRQIKPLWRAVTKSRLFFTMYNARLAVRNTVDMRKTLYNAFVQPLVWINKCSSLGVL